MKRVMKMIDEENKEGIYEIVCSFDSELTNKSYVIYTEYCENHVGELLVKGASYVEDGDFLRVDTRLTSEEYEMISDVLKSLMEQVKKKRKEKK